jgi:hypothetical protein
MKKLFLLLLLITVTAFGQTVPSYVPTNGLVGWWPFNGNANDQSGNGNNGTPNGALLTSDRFGFANRALDFDGVDDRVEIPHNAMINCQSVTIVAWIKPDSYLNSDGNQSQVVSKREWTGWGNSYEFGIGKDPMNNYSNNSNNAAYVNYTVSSNTTKSFATNQLTTSSWSMITYTHDNLNVKLYLNDSLMASFPSPGLLPNGNTLPVWFGARPGNNGRHFFNGKIDDVGIWNRALDSQEIGDLFKGCSDSIFTQPDNFSAFAIPGWANFKCTSTDTAATFQWQQSSGAGWIDLTNLGNYSGATSDSLVITGVTSSMNNYGYRCIVASCTTDTSDVAVLTVTNGIGLGESTLQKLTVSPNPTSGLVSLNSSVIGSYELLALDGRVLESGTAKKDYDLSQQPNGVYNLKLTTADGTRVLKIVKN